MRIPTKQYSAEFHWNIENFHLISVENGVEHRSPSFYTKWRGQSWKLVLFPKGTEGSYTDIGLYLMKVHPFLDNKTYHINLSIGHCGELPHTEILYRNRRDFPVGNADFLPIDPRRSFFEKTVVVSCYLEEVHSHADDLSEELMVYQKLSHDLKNLYESRRCSDLKFLIDQREIYAHKCILSVRCLGFHRQFGYRKIRDMPECIEVTHISFEAFEQFISFLYAGELKSTDVSLELLGYAGRTNVSSLLWCVGVPTCEYHAKTSPNIEHLTLKWNLDAIQQWFAGSVPPVQVFRTKCLRPLLFIVQLLVVEVSEDERWFELKMKFIDYSRSELLDDSAISVAWKLTLGSHNDPLVFEEVECKYIIEDEWHDTYCLRLPDDFPLKTLCSLNLTTDFYLSDGNCDKRITNTCTSFSTNFTSYNTDFKTLGRDLRYLYNSRGSLVDVRFLTRDKLSCMCHKALLWARWPAIRGGISLSEMNRDHTEINIGLSLETLLKYLSYLYYGDQFDLSPNDISELVSLDQIIELPAYLLEV
ncbi:speckle-type POZ protein [Caerostris extrusa]|uniref:Speckle-type POZ protein n=1 Tax=Caerostris extrusa TaxID=172846 RepID=A0AAV4TXM7_CAEEX|nr:speckle-type POZ protein [Caerostris extrusa]